MYARQARGCNLQVGAGVVEIGVAEQRLGEVGPLGAEIAGHASQGGNRVVAAQRCGIRAPIGDMNGR